MEDRMTRWIVVGALAACCGSAALLTGSVNHLINETPSVMYVHDWGEGQAGMLAAGVKDALSRSRTPMG
jgi:hypothetical protein